MPFLKTEKFYAVLKGGAGSGKSHAVAQKIITRCLDAGVHRFLGVRKVKNTLRQSVFKIIKRQLSEMGVREPYVKVNNTELSFAFHNGSEIITTGLDDVEKLKSIDAVTGIWIEEATELEADDLSQLDLRLRGATKSYKQMMLSFNPVSEDHWLKKRFFDEKNKRVFIHNSTIKDNIVLLREDPDYMKRMIAEYSKDPNLKRIYIDGEWGRIVTGQEFYSRFKHQTHVMPTSYNPDLPLHISFDFNVNPYMPLSIWQIELVNDIYECRCIDEITAKNPDNDTERVCEIFMKRYPEGQVYYYGDASGKARSTASRKHNYDIIEEVLFRYLNNYSKRVPNKNPLVAKRRMFVNFILDNKYDIKVIIDPNCVGMIADLENVLESPDGGKHKKMAKDPVSKIPYEKYGHFSDTFDYFFCGAFLNLFKDFQKK